MGPEEPDSPMSTESMQHSPVRHEASTQTEETDVPVTPEDDPTIHDVDITRSRAIEKVWILAQQVRRYSLPCAHSPRLPRVVLSASQHLQQCGRSNVVYQLARAIGMMRPDGSDSRLPAKRMPMGLIEHMVHFFNAGTYQKVSRLSH